MTSRIEAYVEVVNSLIVANEARIGSDRFPELHKTAFVRLGKKYAKVVTAELGKTFTHESVHSFIDMTNGDVLMASSYKAPAKHGARANIFADDLGRSGISCWGANYK